MTPPTNDPKQDYILTDGQETYATRYLSQAEAEELNRTAQAASDGEVWWQLAKSSFSKELADTALYWKQIFEDTAAQADD